jgi:hypothetical protein
MLSDDVLLVLAIGLALGVVGWPVYVLFVRAPWQKKDPLAEAQERLKQAQRDAEVARLNRETERIYDAMVDEAVQDHPATGSHPEQPAEAIDPPEKSPGKGAGRR